MDASEAQNGLTALAQSQSGANSMSESKRVSVEILQNSSLTVLSTLLNPTKIIPTKQGILRDWRGLAELCEISGQYIPSLKNEIDPTSRILRMWTDKDKNVATIEKLLEFLEKLDRFDIVDDLTPLIEKDLVYHKEHPPNLKIQPILKVDESILTKDDLERSKKGLEPQLYHGFLLFDDADIAFASEVIEKMENEYGLKLCVRRRDLISGIPEMEAIIELISDRCRKLIVIVSQAFFASEEKGTHKFFYGIAQGIAIEQRCRKIIPCIYNDIDRLPADIQYYSKIDFRRPYPNWERLRNSLVTLDDIPTVSVMPPVITELPAERPRVSPGYSLSNPNPGLKSIIHAKGHGSKHSSEHVKFKSSSTGNIPETEEKSSTSHMSSSTINLDDVDDIEPDKIKKKKAIRSEINKFFNHLTGTFTLKKSKSKSNAAKTLANGLTNTESVSIESQIHKNHVEENERIDKKHVEEIERKEDDSTAQSIQSQMDKNHIEENERKEDDSTTEKQKEEEKSAKIDKKPKIKLKNWLDSMKKRRKTRALVAE